MNKRIFLSSPHMSDEGYEMDYIKEAFDTNWIAPLGENVNQFESEICEVTGAKAAVALSAGTAALHLGLKALGVGKGDLVFCQSLTFSASANPIIYQDAVPVFIDSEEDTWNMSPEALETAFKKYEMKGVRPKAVIVVHLYGIAARMDEIQEICKRYDTPILEDAAESLGTSYKGKMTGTFGDYGILSFNGNKIITSSGGGMLLCNTENAEKMAEKARFWATQAREPERYYQHKELGYNYRMSNITAGIGRGQLKVLSQRIDKKREIFTVYEQAFKEIDDIEMMPLHEEYQRCNCWLSSIIMKEECSITPLDIQVALEKDNIEARHVWKPMHLQPFFRKYDYIDNGNISENIFKRGVCLPSDTKMAAEDLTRVIDNIKGLWKSGE
ncbi:DegT/DnrJ/EryC1/StrS family aminotransferase [Anaerostipes caccae]|uniref:DegT/DnrJ/EryC1/StrS family aminotransferase n=1 Tax=Anaerostipes caccae TaxID=105841 RepID=UPI001D088B19|nr:aminotransferase class I/II-fold pyridoxal phosphate-dependent enzyme [Anaerostipes caccae]MCB6295552.1 aminotransferase class I/II-fold pyridoxal phosphate-dependent enzyme [Anaerostipes caccae]MCB6335173.1 aminotransferase class I/II-fold pyridoxal phosphate-dependent enzyme [Anaerostipes caccae]MCB6338277.1 aminotransferase class I/II-fold pyridoxal phosphate-dependent enzyme [Anaerostipes caccae]MCB6352799.1 aminotransferase class I/II-fold pyridoxal phosphate-dependent enzyme [Anaerosti